MPNHKLSMPQIKQVLRCYAAGKGTKSIASLLDLSRTTVKKYINTFNQCGKSIEEVLAMEESDLLRLFNEKPDTRPPLPKSGRYLEAMERIFTDNEIDRISHGKALRVLRDVCG